MQNFEIVNQTFPIRCVYPWHYSLLGYYPSLITFFFFLIIQLSQIVDPTSVNGEAIAKLNCSKIFLFLFVDIIWSSQSLFSIFFLGYNLNITSYASRLDSTILYLVRPDGQNGLLKDKINHIVITVSTSFIGRTSFISADYSINGDHSGSVTGYGSTRVSQESFLFFSFQYFPPISLLLFLLLFIIIPTSAKFQHI